MTELKSERGFTLAALMVAIGVMSVMLAVALPIWSRVAQREREEELIFRGNQYVIAIDRYYRKFQRLPLKLEELNKNKCIRKLYPDPMTKDGQWELMYFGSAGQRRDQMKGPFRERIRQSKKIATRPIMGVASKSSKKALRAYNGKWHYNEWQFTYKVKIKKKKKAEEVRKRKIPADQQKSRRMPSKFQKSPKQ